jgi:hypothetical protein
MAIRYWFLLFPEGRSKMVFYLWRNEMRLAELMLASVLAAGMLPTASFAQTAAPVQTAAPAQAGDTTQTANSDLDQVVCRTMPPPVGTRLGARRECHTQREWKAQMDEAQKMMRESSLRNGCAGASCGGGSGN